jgi:competence protein ComEA
MKMQYGVLIKTLLSTFIALLLSVTSVMSHAKEVNKDTIKQIINVAQLQTVNINKSNVSELITLKGIGESKARAIINYRQKFGSFKRISELSEVNGVGTKIINDNKSRLTI